MPDPTDEKWTNAYDVGRRGEPADDEWKHKEFYGNNDVVPWNFFTLIYTYIYIYMIKFYDYIHSIIYLDSIY